MIILGVAVAAVAAFLVSSIYYTLTTPLERRSLGGAVIDRGRPVPWKVATELLRTAVVAAGFAWIAALGSSLHLPDTLVVALVAWITFPVVLLTGSVIWEGVRPITAAIHAGDWLLKLVLIAVAVSLLH
jgi:hypothetical protein